MASPASLEREVAALVGGLDNDELPPPAPTAALSRLGIGLPGLDRLEEAIRESWGVALVLGGTETCRQIAEAIAANIERREARHG